jgi:ribonuclease HI
MMDMDRYEWKVEFCWVKVHARQRGKELADRLAKEASSNRDIEECYNRIPKSTVTN